MRNVFSDTWMLCRYRPCVQIGPLRVKCARLHFSSSKLPNVDLCKSLIKNATDLRLVL